MAKSDLGWAIPVMRAGYSGRGLTYVAVAGISLWAVWRGGQAQGTESVFAILEGSTVGMIVLLAIGVGLLAYTVWRLLCAWYDLEEYGNDTKGTIARSGQLTTGLIHGALGLGALLLVFTASDGGGESGIVTATSWLMARPGGVWLVGIAGAATVGAGLYYLHKGWTGRYRDKLRASEFTTRWNPILKAGVVAQGGVVAIIGAFLILAALRADPDQAGGLDKAFEWVASHAYGQALVTLLCLGLLAFALFCFVNAAYRIVPKVAEGEGLVSLAQRLARG